MEVILLEKVQNLGGLGDKVRVRPGYGRNYLIPSGKAVPATEENLKVFEARRAELEKVAADILTEAQSRHEKIHGIRVVIQARVGEEGKLFGSVGTSEIANAITATGTEVQKKEVTLPSGALRHVGEFEIAIDLHSDAKTTVTVVIEPET